MHFLSTIPTWHKEVYVAASAIVVLFALWIWARFGRHRYVHIKRSESVQLIVMQLSRIADAMDHLAVAIERHPPAGYEDARVTQPPASQPLAPENRHVNMSMLGR